MNECVVALDIGGSYLKATLFELGSDRFATHGLALPVISPEPGWHERGPDALWTATIKCLRKLFSSQEFSSDQVVALGITGHGNGAYLLGPNGQPTRNAILATDTRASEMTSRWVAEGREEELRNHAWNGLWAGLTGPLMSWLAVHEPESLHRSRSVLGAKDFLRARLTGVSAAEITQASACGVYDNSPLVSDPDIPHLEPGELALQVFEIERWRDLFPDSIASMTLYGLSSEAAVATGLPEGLPVVAGLVDNPAVQHGSGIFDSSAICVGAGTWSINQFLIPADEMTAASTLGRVSPYSATAALAGQGLLCEASATSASTFSWAMERAVTATADAARRTGRDPYTARLEADGARRRRTDDPIFLPFINGSRDNPNARGAWLGLSGSTGEDEMLGAVLEGICMEHRRHVERLEKAVDRQLPVRLSGGLSRSPAWCEIFADVFQRPVDVSPIGELGSLAVAAMAATAVGRFADVPAAVSELAGQWQTYQPNEDNAEATQARWAFYKESADHIEALSWLRASPRRIQ